MLNEGTKITELIYIYVTFMRLFSLYLILTLITTGLWSLYSSSGEK